MLSRRKFIQESNLIIMGSYLLPFIPAGSDMEGMIMTVNGAITPADLKFTLTHEHIMVDFIGALKISKTRYDFEEVVKTALPFLQAIKEKGCNSFVDCTPAYLGRDAVLLQRLSKAAGLNIITNTGYYGAAGEKYLPAHVYTETAQQLAQSWINEWKNGIDGTGIKPGFIKTGVDDAPLSNAQVKIITAAAITHLQTGLTIAVHTGNGEAAKQQLDILQKNGVAPAARIWVHAQNEKDTAYHIEAAKKGSWISFDGVNAGSLDANINFLQVMQKEGLLDQVLVSQDSGWYHVGEPGGGTFNSYQYIQTDFIPAMKKNGFTQAAIDKIFLTNPAKALTIKVRQLV
jgi:predicted metal-dependent phosphotriesterase family hydrolase